MKAGTFAPLLQGFFTERLLQQQGASPHTVASYRDTFRLLLLFACERLHKPPARIAIEDFTPAFLGDFLRHLEVDRGNSIRTRNGRLSALRAFFRFVIMSEPALALQCQQVLAVPAKRYEHNAVAFLDEREAATLVAAPDTRTWIGRRDRVLLQVAIQTGMRNTEITSLCWQNVSLGVAGHVRCLGKGRKTRCTPLRRGGVSSTVVRRAKRNAGNPGIPQFQGWPPERGCSAGHRRPAHGHRQQVLSDPGEEARDAAHSEAYGGHGPSPPGRGLKRDCPLAGSRVIGNDPDLPAR